MADPAEARPTGGEPTRNPDPTERIQRIREAVLREPRSICLERPRLLPPSRSTM